ncbi:hypothetical protein F4808DRAFT_307114 [Astrocystis sublimbata]|nr:hypothetical protein F4808DRAFT_63428 [Astrocystis sublimbata]KAI0204696.1 hypothetical protein F4808DRAFT_307114 [Astrocystis sublimbata]
MSLAAIRTQFFPPRNGAPPTEANLPRQHGKVFIVTGGSVGLGCESTILHFQSRRLVHGIRICPATIYFTTFFDPS